MKKFAVAAAIAASFVSIAPAAAQEITQVEVSYGDLDIASPAGVEVLNARLQAGADTVCARPDNRDLKSMAAWQQCKEAAVQNGIRQLATKGIQLAD